MAKKRSRRTKQNADDVLDAALKQVREGHLPNVEACEQFGTVAVVDPFDGALTRKVTALRDDPLGQMHRRGQLLTGDEKRRNVSPTIADARLEAGRRWQILRERAEIGGAQAIDPGKPVVDGGRFAGLDTDGSISARDELDAVRRRLGMIDLTPSQRIHGERLLIWVLGDKKTLNEVAAIIGIDRRLLHLTRHLVEKLDIVAVHLRVSMLPNRPTARLHDRHDDTADRYLRSFQTFSGNESKTAQGS